MTDQIDIAVAGVLTVCVMGTAMIGETRISDSISRNAAIQTATLAELTGPKASVVVVREDFGIAFSNQKTETFYDRADGTRCYLAIDGVAVPNTCYQPK